MSILRLLRWAMAIPGVENGSENCTVTGLTCEILLVNNKVVKSTRKHIYMYLCE